MEARAAEELLREGLPEGVRVQGGDDGGIRTPVAGESSDEAMDEEGKEDETGEMDDEENMEEDKAEDTEMILLENESPLESLFR